MGSQAAPILQIDKFALADTVRADRNRLPGACVTLRNTAPSLSGLGERIRRGYAAYTDVTAPTGTEILKVAPIQNPSQEDVHIFFASSGGQKVYMNPWWKPGGSKQSTNLWLAENATAPADVGVGAFDIIITGTDALGFLTTTDYYKNFLLVNFTRSQNALITGNYYSSGSGGSIDFTTLENIGGGGFNWTAGDVLIVYRNFHDDPGFSLTYNSTLADPPTVPVPIDSIIRFSGGQSSAPGNVGIRIDPYLSKTFFPSASGGFVFTGTYASKRKCSAMDKDDLFDLVSIFPNAGLALTDTSFGLALAKNSTYWIGVACVYDGFQIGELTTFEETTDYDDNGVAWSNHYAFGTSAQIEIKLRIALATLNKRITGFMIYAAQDSGDTKTSGRVNPYYAIAHVPITTVEGNGAGWTFTAGATEKYFSGIILLNALSWNAKGNAYVVDSGYVEIPTDTMYAYSAEFISGLRHYIHNLYVSSAGTIDRQHLFTNPIGGNDEINAGVIQPDVFSNEEEIFKLRTEPTIGTKLTGLRTIGLQEILVTKDRGTLIAREITSPEGTPALIWQTISPDRGCATLDQLVVSDDGWIYFAGYDDIHRYRQGVLENLIEDTKTQNDWLYTYREAITKTSKESCLAWWLPERIIYFDIGQANNQQFAFYPEYGWRQVRFKEVAGAATQFFKWKTQLQSGMVVGVTSDATPEIKKFSNPATALYYYSDGGTAIPYQIDTGDFLPSQDEAIDTVLNFFALSRTFDSPTTGTLDVDLYKGGSLLRTYAGRDKASSMLRIQSLIGDPRIASFWRLRINSNSSPEVLNAGSIFTLNRILLYGEFRARGKRATESVSGTTGSILGGGVSNTIAGKQEVLVNSTNTTFSWDIAFTKSYTGNEGAGIPKYRFEMEPAYVLGGDVGTPENVIIVSKSLTQIVLRSTSDNTLVRFEAAE